jgi:hypothetical protein
MIYRAHYDFFARCRSEERTPKWCRDGNRTPRLPALQQAARHNYLSYAAPVAKPHPELRRTQVRSFWISHQQDMHVVDPDPNDP